MKDTRALPRDAAPAKGDDEPIIVLVLFVLAGLSVVGGVVQGLQAAGAQGMFIGLAAGALSGSGAWAFAVLLRTLHRIERNTRR
ncbi:hypothetical protein [Haloferula sp. BvORR071]|uniref:hypothetical protein n=1 Tax=Haloferula sp. BvORR071 TaxID=1396141 RepID=UPI00055390BB|nr:hypothetical protein [Haloferula sp. BvORR071]